MRDDATTRALLDAHAVPADFAAVVADGTLRIWRDGLEAEVERIARDPDALPRADAAGRAPLGRLDMPGGHSLLVRPYRKGGMLRGVRGARFRGRLRPLDELVLHHALAARGIGVLEAVGAVVRGDTSGWEGWLITREEAGARDLQAWLDGASVEGHDDSAATLERAGRAVQDLHAQGVAHPDLHPKNLLLARGGTVLVLDLDRARMADDPLPEGARLANLARFERSLVKQRGMGRALARWDPEPFYRGYGGDDGARWHRNALARRGSLCLRAAWWRLTGATRPGDGA